MGVLERRWFGLLLAHALLLQALVMVLRVAMTYQAVAMGFDALRIGVIGGAFGLVPAVFGMHTGRYIDRLGERFALIAGSAAILSAAAGLLLLPEALAALLAVSIVLGFGQFIGVAGQHSAVGKMEGTGRASAFGWLTMAISAAHAIGPVIVSVFAQDSLLPDTQAIYAVGVLCGALLFVVALLIRTPVHTPISAGQGIWTTARALMVTKGYVLATMASLVIFSAMDLLVIYLPLYGAQSGIGAATIGLLLAIRGAASVVSRLFFGQLLAMFGRDRLLVLGLLLSGVSLAALTLTSIPAVMGGLLFVAGLGLGVGAPLTLVWIADIVDSGMRGSALSLRLAINRLGQAALPVAMGVFVAGTGAGGIILAISAALIASAGVSGFRLRRR